MSAAEAPAKARIVEGVATWCPDHLDPNTMPASDVRRNFALRRARLPDGHRRLQDVDLLLQALDGYSGDVNLVIVKVPDASVVVWLNEQVDGVVAMFHDDGAR